MNKMSMVKRIEDEIVTLNRHINILLVVSRSEPVGVGELGRETGLQNHQVRYSVRILEQEDLIKPSPEGLRTTAQTEQFIVETNDELDRIERKVRAFGTIFDIEEESP